MAGERDGRTVAVVGVDFFSRAPALPVLGAMGLLVFAPNPEIHLVNVRPVPAGPSGPMPYGDSTEARELVDIERDLEALDALGEEHCAGTSVRMFSHVRSGDEVRELTTLARALSASFIVIGRHEHDTAKLVLQGPANVEADLRGAAPCPVFVASPVSVPRRRDPARPRPTGPAPQAR